MFAGNSKTARWPGAAFAAGVLAMVLLAASVAAASAGQPAGGKIDNSPQPGDNLAGSLNRAQLDELAKQPGTARDGDVLQVLVLRGDGGDPRKLRANDPKNLIYTLSRSGEAHAYQNGHEVELNPALKEAAQRIASDRLNRPEAAEPGSIESLPPWARTAVATLRGTDAGGQRPVRVHVVSRDDTARISDAYARKMLALEAQVRGRGDRAGMIELVKNVMRMYGLKSDVCDTSSDSRCNYPGVREAFAEIKRQEAAAAQPAAAKPQKHS